MFAALWALTGAIPCGVAVAVDAIVVRDLVARGCRRLGRLRGQLIGFTTDTLSDAEAVVRRNLEAGEGMHLVAGRQCEAPAPSARSTSCSSA